MFIVLRSEKLSLVEVEAFLEVSRSMGFAADSRTEIYGWSESALHRRKEYSTQTRRAKGVIRTYMERMSGLSGAQCTRLI